ncbi:Whole genome shotgun assembly, reference scaffold old set, scaffold scaffold_65, related [Eimeria necatrix]|uniref:Whole genome shotgun assembly, reference scaffold old set, scaffold scaffold_65, related n=1 Tax=Eimeria necatrix TaxID=51315 RepID=U6N0J3_9EIME|nr:Whole genome shotgun assembly, reference scaffold old set, scaffold scaffold_65, related [Eimeria necatrix]CDJ68269.1 Whole genome shotgun assembly, reference scaffold old set, scaffold scaffold_65, related [Eimeria necatrix]
MLQREAYQLVQQQLQQLQMRRQQLLQQQLRRVDAEFSALFKQLVPGGTARLELIEDPCATSTGETAELSGVEIQVDFNAAGKSAESLPMQRLSGGQKALVAVALLLAQQMASGGEGGREGLLLLDEPDSALDETHARHLAEALLNSTRNLGCQIILTTLRKELLICGDKFWLVQQHQRASQATEISEQEASAVFIDLPQMQQQLRQQPQHQRMLPHRHLPDCVESRV